MTKHEPLGGRIFTLPFLVLLVVAAMAAYVLYQRLAYGLGAVTNLSDGYPWGIWIAIDLVAGTALGCAGYAIALLVYILNRGEYHPLVRPALLASLFGYTLGGLAVMIDLGRYWQGHNIFLPWLSQYNSVMLETALCIAAYITVLLIEFSPVVLERLGMKNVRKRLSKVLFVFIGLGVLLPTMHQSSMGTILVILGHQLSPLWQTQLLPLMFLVSAVYMGFAIVVFEAVLSSVGFKRPMESFILGKLCTILAWMLLGYLVLRFVDLVWRDAIGYAFDGSTAAIMFWIENIVQIIALPLLFSAGDRPRPQPMFIAGSLLLVGGTLYRVNAYLIGYDPGNGWVYFPSVGEIVLTLGIFSIEIMLYIIFVKHLPILHAPQESSDRRQGAEQPVRPSVEPAT